MNQKRNFVYPIALLGAVLLGLLRVFDTASGLSVALVTLGVTALVYGVRHADSKKEYGFVAGVMAVAFIVRCYGYTGVPVADVVGAALIGLIMFGLMNVERLLKRFADSFLYTLIFPVAYLLFMYFTEAIKINMPFRLDTYFSCIPVLCQITSLVGIYSLDFLLAWTASVLVFLLDHKASKQSLILAIVYVAVLGGVIGFGVVHMNQMEAEEAEKTDTVRVACAAGPYIGTLSDGEYAEFPLEEDLDSFTGIVKVAAEQDAEILVFCEESYDVDDTEEATLLKRAEKLAAKYDMHLLLAYEVADTDDSEEGKSINKLCWISNEGDVLYDYTKHCIIPFIETFNYVRGDKNIAPFDITVDGKDLTIATAICYDSDFDTFMSHVGDDVDLLLLPTWDWGVIDEEHFGVARLRAIQTETTLVRSVYDGWDAVIDSAGHVLHRENTNDIGYENVTVYDVPVDANN